MTNHSPDDPRAKLYDVFISYKREDDAAREVLVDALEEAGCEVFWDAKLDYDDVYGGLRGEIDRCDLVICLWSKRAASSEHVKAEARHAFRAGKLLSAPIEDKSVIPQFFRRANLDPFDGWADEDRRQAQIAKILGTLERTRNGSGRKLRPRAPAVKNELVAPAEFGDIRGAPDKLIGRDSELDMLRNAWENRSPEKVNAVVLRAHGGAGKSALLRYFADRLLDAGGGGAARIYGWSAYSQGSGEQRHAGADSFIAKALGDFGYLGEPPSDPVERARALVGLIQKERVLLLLDGLEPLQDPPNLNRGRFKDRGLAELIKSLASQNPGLLVLTTRQKVSELAGREPHVVDCPLDKLKAHEAAELLVELGVHGRQRDLEALVREVNGHALSVTLLGTYLTEVCAGDVYRGYQFKFAEVKLSSAEESELSTDETIIDAERAGKVIHRYLDQFEKLAQEKRTAGLGGPERALLRLLGLFERPADGPAVRALLKERIPGLTDDLFVRVDKQAATFRLMSAHKFIGASAGELKPDERSARLREAKSRLRKLALLSKANPKDLQELDAHPVVRVFLADRLREVAPEAARAAHEILYRHYSTSAPDLPSTLEEMQPLFHAVEHGVKAGRVQDVFNDVFRKRITRHEVAYLVSTLGAYGLHLATCSHFFDVPWRTPRTELAPKDQAWLLNSTAYALTANGRLLESVEPREAGLAANIAAGDWASAVMDCAGYTVTLVLLGRISDAINITERGVALGDSSRDNMQREYARANLAATLVMAGRFKRASDLFAESEIIRSSVWSDEPQQYSLQGYIYGELLLTQGRASEALSRGHYMIRSNERLVTRLSPIADLAFGRLLVAVAHDKLGTTEATEAFDSAVEDMRRAGQIVFLPLAFLARAAHNRRRAAAGETKLINSIRADLAEVEDIAGEEMRLYLADLALERARLALDVPAASGTAAAALADAKAQTAKAAQLIAETGYLRRDRELNDLKARLAGRWAEPTELRGHYKEQSQAMQTAEERGEAYYRAWLQEHDAEARVHDGDYIAINCERAEEDRFNSHTIGHGLSSARRAFRQKFGNALCWVRPIKPPERHP